MKPVVFRPAALLLFLISSSIMYTCKNRSDSSTPIREEYEYYSSGEPEKKYSLVDGKREGPCEWYYKDGNLKGIIRFSNDLQEGKTEFYYPDGKLREVQYFKAGKQIGWDSIWHSNGQLFQVNHFENGKLEGDQYHYDTAGSLQHHGLFQADTLVKLIYTR